MSDIRVVVVVEQPTAGVRESVPMAELSEFFARAFRETTAALHAQGLHPVGPPFGLYRGAPGATVDVEAGFPVASPVAAAGAVVPDHLPGGKAIEALHTGPYDTMARTYAEIEAFAADQGLSRGATVWETYLSDPETEPDPATWRTRITWPLA